MSGQTSFEIPLTVRNISHDFRIAIHSYNTDIKDVANIKTANLILYPEGVTNVTFGCSTNTSAVQGSFSLIGGVRSQAFQAVPKYVDSSNQSVVNGQLNIETARTETSPPTYENHTNIENQSLDLSAMFGNIRARIKLMDYIVIYTKDVRTNLWYGSKQEAEDVPSDAKPKYIGLVTAVSADYNPAISNLSYNIKFCTLLRLLELSRFAMELSQFDRLSQISGADLSTEKNIYLDQLSFGADLPPHQFIKKFVETSYPKILIGDRIEEDVFRIEPRSLNQQNYSVSSIQSSGNYETKLNKLKQAATKKDFEFYAAEDGNLVWKLPTYCRGVNKKSKNFVSSKIFDPTKPQDESYEKIYHIHEFISMSLSYSEAEILNVASGPQDFRIELLGEKQGGLLKEARLLYFIRGSSNESVVAQRFGFAKNGFRTISVQNPLYYNIGTYTTFGQSSKIDINTAQMMYYDYRLYKNNYSKYVTASLSMIDDPRIECGMPIVIPLLALRTNSVQLDNTLPSIFYVSSTARRYEVGKAPVLTLTLTHGRPIDEEFSNGLFIEGYLSSWMARFEPSLFWRPDAQAPFAKEIDAATGLMSDAQPVITNSPLDFTKNDARIQTIISLNNVSKK